MSIASEAEARAALGLLSTITDEERAALNLFLPQAEAVVKSHLQYDPEQRVATEFYPRADPSGGYIRTGVAWDVDSSHRAARAYAVGGGGQLHPTLQLARLPVRSVTGLWIDYDGKFGQAPGAFGSGTEEEAGVGFWIEVEQENVGLSGCLFGASQWPREPGSVKVAYRAGYSPIELLGRATADETDADGNITSAGVDGSPIKRAVLMTVSGAMQKWDALKKSKTGFQPNKQSEKLGDYSYTLGANAIATLAVDLPAAAAEVLEPYVNYGVLRL